MTTMQEVHQNYMDGCLAHPNHFSMNTYNVLETIDQVLNQTVGIVHKGVVYKKMSQRMAKEDDYGYD